MEKRLNRFNKIYPWFAGLSGDLLFWIAIDTLFLQIVKDFTPKDIVAITAVSDIVGIAFQLPTMKIVEKIGNTKSIRVGTLLTIVSASTLTFGKSFIVIAVGRAFREIAYSFKAMGNVVLEHNLTMQSRGNDYVKYSTKANTIYAIVTMVIAVIASPMFNINHYLPMVCCIAVCILCAVLSFLIADYTENGKIEKSVKKQKVKISFDKVIIIAFISFGIFYSIVATGQENAKLFIQDGLLGDFSEDNTSLIIGVIIFISRVVRVLANVLFYKIYNKIKDKVGMLFGLILLMSFLFLIIGNFINNSFILKYSIMAVGYIIILFARDPFKVYINNLVLSISKKEQHQRIMMMLEFSRKIMTAVISVSFAAILQIKPMLFIIVLYAIYACLEIGICGYLYFMLKKQHKKALEF